ncbi:MAG: type II secretion system F family protein [Candidatus Omnitrophica bacterium]|nr:type II secretion system F family protein [Candidatus Omnitrophota bacterium]MDD5310413.1 type II secretion system F family protein [Candidatus Omnitrophota bacterium]MDD5546743.1 type II secretion system F family protein [Candidatus Omnitrophota bacterium]
MPQFKYVAKDKDGRTVSGSMEAPSSIALVDTLRQKEYVIISLGEAKEAARGQAFGGAKIKLDDLVVFSRQLATMVDAGIPLVGALDALQEQMESKGFKNVVKKVRDNVEGGLSLSEALGKQPNVFSPFFINMVRAGESSGNLDEILDRVAIYMEKTIALIRKVKSSLIYPAVVVTMAILITTFLIVKVVPTFESIFATIGVTLPLPTLILIKISHIVRSYLLFVIIGLVIGSITLSQVVKTDKGKLAFDTFLLKIPVIGPLLRKVAIARFARTLSTLQKSGVSILTALEIVGKTSGNRVIEAAVLKTKMSIKEGESIAQPLTASKVFPPMVTRMISVGEQTGKLEEMLGKVADFYESEVDAAVSGLTSLIEPLIIAFLGIVVGGIVVSMFLPIVKLIQVVGR